MHYSLYDVLTFPNFPSIRVELGEDGPIGEHEEFIRHDAATIQDTRNILEISIQNKDMTKGSTRTDDTSFLSTVAQSDLSQLVAVRRAHQTKRAANSVKTRTNPHDAASYQPPEQTDRQRLCAQMVEVIRRAGSGLERDARWKSGTAPGTRGHEEVLTLTGNSANAEVAAKERVNAVCHLVYWIRELLSHHNLHRQGQRAPIISTVVA